MIIKKNNSNLKIDYLQEEKKGLTKAIDNLNKRFKKNEISREKFLKQNSEFAKRHIELNKKINKLK